MTGRWARAGWVAAGILACTTGVLGWRLAVGDDPPGTEPDRVPGLTVTRTVDCTLQSGELPDDQRGRCAEAGTEAVESACLDAQVSAVDVEFRSAGDIYATHTIVCPAS